MCRRRARDRSKIRVAHHHELACVFHIQAERTAMRYLRPVLATVALTVTFAVYFAFAQSGVQAQGGGGGRQAGPPPPMSFFVTSTSKGQGANYGGLAGADAFC